MKGKMSIKNILAIASLVIFISMFLNMSLAADTIETANSTEDTSSDVTAEQTTTEEEVEGEENAQTNEENAQEEVVEEQPTEEAPVEETQQQQEENTGKYFIADDVKIKVIPLINASEIADMKKGQEVYVDKRINGWAYVETEIATGWIREEKLKTEEQKQADDQAQAAQEAEAAKAAQEEADKNAPVIKKLYVKTEKVNIRKEANTTSESLGKITKNTEVDVIAEEGQWSKCRMNGLVGFFSTQYFTDKKEEPTSRASKARTVTADTQIKDIAASENSSSVVELAKSLVGKKYVHGGTGPDAFDCSGLTRYVYARFGVNLPHSSESQRSCGVEVSRSALQPGDLICYSGHVAIYIGGGKVVHAATPSKGVCISTIDGAKPGAYKCARRIL